MLAPMSRNLEPGVHGLKLRRALSEVGLGCLAGSVALIKRRLASRSANGLKDSGRNVLDPAT
jgi:hypothetical protein